MLKVFISPHFDDAICSCAANMLISKMRGNKVLLLTIFNKGTKPYSDFAKELHYEWGAINAPKKRYCENKNACKSLGIDFLNLNFEDALYRRNIQGLLYPRNDGQIFKEVQKEDSLLHFSIANKIMNLFSKIGTEFYFPIAKGHHVDHVIAYKIGCELIKLGYKVKFYEEFYYNANINISNYKKTRIFFDNDMMTKKIKAICNYSSQLKMLFGSKNFSDILKYYKTKYFENDKFYETYYELKSNNKVNYIGVNYDGKHDSTIAYYTDKIEYIGQEERFSRKKKDGRKPKKSFEYLFRHYDVDMNNLKYVFPILDYKESKKEWEEAQMIDIYKSIYKDMRNGINYAYDLTDNPIFVRHHDAHAASAYFTSGFLEKTLICTIDGGNDFDPYSTNLYEGNNGKIKVLKRYPDISIASNYLLITAALGFKPLEGEGKVTGLSSFGHYNENLIKELENILSDKNLIHKIAKWKNVGSETKTPKIKITKKIKVFNNVLKYYNKEDIAFAIQYITEEKVRKLLTPFKSKYSNIVLAGGIFANVKLNSFIKELGFEKIYIHPAMGDDGLALGAILFHISQTQNLLPFEMKNIYFGANYQYAKPDLERMLTNENLTFEYYDKNLEKTIAEKLAEGKIVALYQSRQEYGPRALGHRSILVNASNKNINDILNKKLKRTEFMPFAPVVYDKQAKFLFNDLDGTEYACKFMTITRSCTNLMKNIGKAAVHIDGTARPQIVDENTDKFYYNILKEYAKKTKNQSVLINTSFNMHGEPIVSTPKEAIKSFKNAKLDYLVIDNYLIKQ